MMRILLATCALVALLSSPAIAQEETAKPNNSSAAPVEISADKGLVWDRTAHTYTAKGRAEARQGDLKVTSDVLVARYAAEGSSSDIREVSADGNVVLTSAPYTAYGDKAVYDLTSGVAVLTGGNLRVMTPTEMLTARDRLTYEATDGRMTAEGNAKLTRPTDSLEAQTLTATFATSDDGSRGLDTVTATGEVTIKTARETITGAKGVYRAASQTAELTGKVVITQDKNRLEGSRAVVDMKTGVSQLYGAASTGGRVKGVFYPKDKNAPAVVVPVAAPVAATAPMQPGEIKKSYSIVDGGTPPVQAVAEKPAELPAQENVTDSVKEAAKEATPVGEPVNTAQEEAVIKQEEEPAQAITPVADLPAEPFSVPPANDVNPTQSSTPVAVDKPELNP